MLFATGDVSGGGNGEERGETAVFAGYEFRSTLWITEKRLILGLERLEEVYLELLLQKCLSLKTLIPVGVVL